MLGAPATHLLHGAQALPPSRAAGRRPPLHKTTLAHDPARRLAAG